VIANPRPGARVVLWYAPRARPYFLHAAAGVVVVAGKGRPRNHLVRLDSGALVVVPCGNLRGAG
jgi:hypothetical protein